LKTHVLILLLALGATAAGARAGQVKGGGDVEEVKTIDVTASRFQFEPATIFLSNPGPRRAREIRSFPRILYHDHPRFFNPTRMIAEVEAALREGGELALRSPEPGGSQLPPRRFAPSQTAEWREGARRYPALEPRA